MNLGASRARVIMCHPEGGFATEGSCALLRLVVLRDSSRRFAPLRMTRCIAYCVQSLSAMMGAFTAVAFVTEPGVATTTIVNLPERGATASIATIRVPGFGESQACGGFSVSTCVHFNLPGVAIVSFSCA